ncbi:MAG: hypothetical protein V4662_11915 [Verrucomicrobiota bacterium]
MSRRITPPEQLCKLPHGMPCLAHRRVFSGELQPCVNCAPYEERMRGVLNIPRVPAPETQPAEAA